jgi:hypothetical protein
VFELTLGAKKTMATILPQVSESQEPNKPEDIDMFFVDVAQSGNTLHGFSLVFGESPESSTRRSTLAANRIGGLSCSMGNFNVPQRFATKIGDTR